MHHLILSQRPWEAEAIIAPLGSRGSGSSKTSASCPRSSAAGSWRRQDLNAALSEATACVMGSGIYWEAWGAGRWCYEQQTRT